LAGFSLYATVGRALRGLGAPSRGQALVVGLSGGPDSVALLDALLFHSPGMGFRLVAAHLDHALRPDSVEDAAFSEELCRRLAVPFRSARADVRGRAARDGSGLEEAARLERYAFFRAVMREEAASFVAVAHTRDDQAETLLLRLLRGAGSAGLGAMRPRAGDVLRPLLAVSRAQVLAHLEARGLPFRDDPTNADLGIPRNRVRHELIPYIESRFNPRIREALARTAGLLADDAETLADSGEAISGGARSEGEGRLLSLDALRLAPRAVARAALRQTIASVGGLRGVGAIHVERLLRLARSASPSGRALALPGGREAQFRFGDLWIGPRPRPAEDFRFDVTVPGRVSLPGGLSLIVSPSTEKGSPGAAVVGAPGPLVARTRRPGDRIRAHGRDMSLKRYLMDHRVPASDRARIPVVASGDRVIWVAGLPAEPALPSEPLVRLELVPTVMVEGQTGDTAMAEAVVTPLERRAGAEPPFRPEPMPMGGTEADEDVPFLERPQGGPPFRASGIHSRARGTSMKGPTEDAEPRRVSGVVP
jgi:tRNA(Ile)-lysidine synthase